MTQPGNVIAAPDGLRAVDVLRPDPVAGAAMTPAPGTIGLSRIDGALGWWISAGQALSGDAANWTHAFIVLDQDTVIQAEPKGARIAPLAPYLAPDAAVFLHGWPRLNRFQVAKLQNEAERLRGTPYSFLDYLSLAALALRIRPQWLKNYVASSGHMICSQLVDHLMCVVGAQLFDDGRPSQDVTPGDICNAYVRALSQAGLNPPPAQPTRKVPAAGATTPFPKAGTSMTLASTSVDARRLTS
jgi:hypothetical protein